MENPSSSQLVYNNSIKSTKNVQVNERIIIPYFSLYSDRIVIHPRIFTGISKRKYNSKSLKNLKKKKFAGQISKTQKLIIKKRLTAWLTSIEIKNNQNKNSFTQHKHYPVFITLTLSASQQHSDQEIKKRLLDQIIKVLKRKYKITEYFWRAEKQKNGNIHFHLIVDKYVDYKELKKEWNKIQNKLNYINRFADVFLHRNPNSVDVRSAEQVKNFVNYVLKYCLKDEKNQVVEGRVFGMSDNLREIGVYQNVLDGQLSAEILRYEKYNYFKVYKQEYATVIIFEKSFYKTSFYNQLKIESESYYLELYENIYNPRVRSKKIIKEFKEKIIKKPEQLTLKKLTDQIKTINQVNLLNTKDENKYRNQQMEKSYNK